MRRSWRGRLPRKGLDGRPARVVEPWWVGRPPVLLLADMEAFVDIVEQAIATEILRMYSWIWSTLDKDDDRIVIEGCRSLKRLPAVRTLTCRSQSLIRWNACQIPGRQRHNSTIYGPKALRASKYGSPPLLCGTLVVVVTSVGLGYA